MKVGIIGSGVVGQTLAAGFLKHGHQVEIGTRDPAKLKTGSDESGRRSQIVRGSRSVRRSCGPCGRRRGCAAGVDADRL